MSNAKQQRKFQISYPDEHGNNIDEILTEDEILSSYYAYWSNRMIEKFGEKFFVERFTTEDCIQDWITIHWAVEVK